MVQRRVHLFIVFSVYLHVYLEVHLFFLNIKLWVKSFSYLKKEFPLIRERGDPKKFQNLLGTMTAELTLEVNSPTGGCQREIKT